jgi:protein-disulfide isomerase
MKGVVVKLQWKLLCLITLSILFAFSCTKGVSKPSYVFKKNAGDGVAAKIGTVTITEQDLHDGIESDIYEAEQKLYDIKFNRLKTLVIEKLMKSDPKSKGMSNDQYMDKYITAKAKVSNKQIDAFIKEKKIPAQSINPQIKERIKSYLLVEEKKKMIDSWLASKTKKTPIEVYLDKPTRPSYKVEVADAPFAGGEKATVEVVEFSDFQCPFCARAAEILNQIKKKYGSKVKVAFKQFPLPFHSQAKTASVAALCANEQSTKFFWKMHDAMFADQSKLAVEALKETAKKIGVNIKKFNECLDSNRYLKQVDADIEQGKKVGVKSTPTFYVNGQQVTGAQPIEVFSEIIDSELKK